MKSTAAIGNHPLHPAIVPIPIVAYFLALLGDIFYAAKPDDPFWYDFSRACIGVGLVMALVAALFGAIDGSGERTSAMALRRTTRHAAVSLSVAILYAISFFLRRGEAATMQEPRWPVAMVFSTFGFLLLAIAGWFGGKLAYAHRVGVIEVAQTLPRRTDAERVAS